MRKKVNIILVLLSALMLFSCQRQQTSKEIYEGTIVYKVNFPKTENKSQLIGIMPEDIEMSFKNNNTAMIIKGFAGSFRISFITNNEQNKYYSLVRIVTDKFQYVTDSSGIAFGYDMLKDMTIEYLNQTDTICGLNCKKAIAHCPLINKDLELWYTNEIKISNPNINNAFKELKGVLVKFQVILSGIFMEFTANKIINEPVDDKVFEIPSDYKEIGKEELENFLKSFDPNL